MAYVFIGGLLLLVVAFMYAYWRLMNDWQLVKSGEVSSVEYGMGEEPDLWLIGAPLLIMRQIPITILHFTNGEAITLTGRFDPPVGNGQIVNVYRNAFTEYKIE